MSQTSVIEIIAGAIFIVCIGQLALILPIFTGRLRINGGSYLVRYVGSLFVLLGSLAGLGTTWFALIGEGGIALMFLAVYQVFQAVFVFLVIWKIAIIYFKEAFPSRQKDNRVR